MTRVVVVVLVVIGVGRCVVVWWIGVVQVGVVQALVVLVVVVVVVRLTG